MSAEPESSVAFRVRRPGPLAALLEALVRLLSGPPRRAPGQTWSVRAGPAAPAPDAVPERAPEPLRAGPRAARFLLTVDDAGQFLVACGPRLSLGHARAGLADLPFLADVGAEHALFLRASSLSGGPAWRVVSLGRERVEVNGRVLVGERTLVAGDRLRFGENLAMRVALPDPASETVLLELEQGAECEGACNVLLFGEGDGGRLRIGGGSRRHVRVARLEHEIVLVRQGDELEVRCLAGVRGGAGETQECFRFPCPPPQRIDLAIGRSVDARPPFGLALEPR